MRTVRSHGWYTLPPFVYEQDGAPLRCTVVLNGKAVVLELSGASGKSPGLLRVKIQAGQPVTSAQSAEARRLVRRMLSLDVRLDDFYAQTAHEPELAWAGEAGAGRFLRGASVYEDAVKMLCTTNCSWALTRSMVRRLVDELGKPVPDGSRAFPTPAAMAKPPEAFYRQAVKAGYRAPYLKEFAERVAAAEINPEHWETSQASSAELRRDICRVKGMGTYAAEGLMRLLGRVDVLAVDSWCLAKYQRLYGTRKRPTAAQLQRRYRRFGPWRGLAMWLDLTRDWHDSSQPPSWP